MSQSSKPSKVISTSLHNSLAITGYASPYHMSLLLSSMCHCSLSHISVLPSSLPSISHSGNTYIHPLLLPFKLLSILPFLFSSLPPASFIAFYHSFCTFKVKVLPSISPSFPFIKSYDYHLQADDSQFYMFSLYFYFGLQI